MTKAFPTFKVIKLMTKILFLYIVNTNVHHYMQTSI